MRFFHASQFSYEQFYYASAEKPDKLFWTRFKRLLDLRVNDWNTLTVEKFCAVVEHRLQMCQPVRVEDFLRDWIQWLHSNVIDFPFVAASQIKDRREQFCVSIPVN